MSASPDISLFFIRGFLSHLRALLTTPVLVSHVFEAIDQRNAAMPARDLWFLFGNQDDPSAHALTLETGHAIAEASQLPFQRSKHVAVEAIHRAPHRQNQLSRIQVPHRQSLPPLPRLHSKYKNHSSNHIRTGSNLSTSPRSSEWI